MRKRCVDSPIFVALFCPRCGELVTDVEVDDTPVRAVTPMNIGSAYTCGWCHTRQVDWNHVKRCRELGAHDEHDVLVSLLRMKAELESRVNMRDTHDVIPAAESCAHAQDL